MVQFQIDVVVDHGNRLPHRTEPADGQLPARG
jgi:hypothetical protein